MQPQKRPAQGSSRPDFPAPHADDVGTDRLVALDDDGPTHYDTLPVGELRGTVLAKIHTTSEISMVWGCQR